MTRSTRTTLLILAILGFAALPTAADPGRGAEVLCYLWANNASPALNTPYTPSSVYSYNTVGRSPAITVTRTATGVYTVTCQGVGGGALFSKLGEALEEERSVSTEQAADMDGAAEASAGAPEASGSWGAGGHVQVTAYGSEDADYCKVSSWSTGGRDFSAAVRCYNHLGQLSDNRFDLLFVW